MNGSTSVGSGGDPYQHRHLVTGVHQMPPSSCAVSHHANAVPGQFGGREHLAVGARGDQMGAPTDQVQHLQAVGVARAWFRSGDEAVRFEGHGAHPETPQNLLAYGARGGLPVSAAGRPQCGSAQGGCGGPGGGDHLPECGEPTCAQVSVTGGTPGVHDVTDPVQGHGRGTWSGSVLGRGVAGGGRGGGLLGHRERILHVCAAPVRMGAAKMSSWGPGGSGAVGVTSANACSERKITRVRTCCGRLIPEGGGHSQIGRAGPVDSGLWATTQRRQHGHAAQADRQEAPMGAVRAVATVRVREYMEVRRPAKPVGSQAGTGDHACRTAHHGHAPGMLRAAPRGGDMWSPTERHPHRPGHHLPEQP